MKKINHSQKIYFAGGGAVFAPPFPPPPQNCCYEIVTRGQFNGFRNANNLVPGTFYEINNPQKPLFAQTHPQNKWYVVTVAYQAATLNNAYSYQMTAIYIPNGSTTPRMFNVDYDPINDQYKSMYDPTSNNYVEGHTNIMEFPWIVNAYSPTALVIDNKILGDTTIDWGNTLGAGGLLTEFKGNTIVNTGVFLGGDIVTFNYNELSGNGSSNSVFQLQVITGPGCTCNRNHAEGQFNIFLSNVWLSGFEANTITGNSFILGAGYNSALSTGDIAVFNNNTFNDVYLTIQDVITGSAPTILDFTWNVIQSANVFFDGSTVDLFTLNNISSDINAAYALYLENSQVTSINWNRIEGGQLAVQNTNNVNSIEYNVISRSGRVDLLNCIITDFSYNLIDYSWVDFDGGAIQAVANNTLLNNGTNTRALDFRGAFCTFVLFDNNYIANSSTMNWQGASKSSGNIEYNYIDWGSSVIFSFSFFNGEVNTNQVTGSSTLNATSFTGTGGECNFNSINNDSSLTLLSSDGSAQYNRVNDGSNLNLDNTLGLTAQYNFISNNSQLVIDGNLVAIGVSGNTVAAFSTMTAYGASITSFANNNLNSFAQAYLDATTCVNFDSNNILDGSTCDITGTIGTDFSFTYNTFDKQSTLGLQGDTIDYLSFISNVFIGSSWQNSGGNIITGGTPGNEGQFAYNRFDGATFQIDGGGTIEQGFAQPLGFINNVFEQNTYVAWTFINGASDTLQLVNWRHNTYTAHSYLYYDVDGTTRIDNWSNNQSYNSYTTIYKTDLSEFVANVFNCINATLDSNQNLGNFISFTHNQLDGDVNSGFFNMVGITTPLVMRYNEISISDTYLNGAMEEFNRNIIKNVNASTTFSTVQEVRYFNNNQIYDSEIYFNGYFVNVNNNYVSNSNGFVNGTIDNINYNVIDTGSLISDSVTEFTEFSSNTITSGAIVNLEGLENPAGEIVDNVISQEASLLLNGANSFDSFRGNLITQYAVFSDSDNSSATQGGIAVDIIEYNIFSQYSVVKVYNCDGGRIHANEARNSLLQYSNISQNDAGNKYWLRNNKIDHASMYFGNETNAATTLIYGNINSNYAYGGWVGNLGNLVVTGASTIGIGGLYNNYITSGGSIELIDTDIVAGMSYNTATSSVWVEFSTCSHIYVNANIFEGYEATFPAAVNVILDGTLITDFSHNKFSNSKVDLTSVNAPYFLYNEFSNCPEVGGSAGILFTGTVFAGGYFYNLHKNISNTFQFDGSLVSSCIWNSWQNCSAPFYYLVQGPDMIGNKYDGIESALVPVCQLQSELSSFSHNTFTQGAYHVITQAAAGANSAIDGNTFNGTNASLSIQNTGLNYVTFVNGNYSDSSVITISEANSANVLNNYLTGLSLLNVEEADTTASLNYLQEESILQILGANGLAYGNYVYHSIPIVYAGSYLSDCQIIECTGGFDVGQISSATISQCSFKYGFGIISFDNSANLSGCDMIFGLSNVDVEGTHVGRIMYGDSGDATGFSNFESDLSYATHVTAGVLTIPAAYSGYTGIFKLQNPPAGTSTITRVASASTNWPITIYSNDATSLNKFRFSNSATFIKFSSQSGLTQTDLQSINDYIVFKNTSTNYSYVREAATYL